MKTNQGSANQCWFCKDCLAKDGNSKISGYVLFCQSILTVQ